MRSRPIVRLAYQNPALDIGRVLKALQRAGYSKRECDTFVAEATKADKDHVYDVIEQYCDVTC